MVVRMELDEGHVNGARYVDVAIDDVAPPAEVWAAATRALIAARDAGDVAPCAGVSAVDGVPWNEYRARNG